MNVKNIYISSTFVCPHCLTIKLNFNISKKAYWLEMKNLKAQKCSSSVMTDASRYNDREIAGIATSSFNKDLGFMKWNVLSSKLPP